MKITKITLTLALALGFFSTSNAQETALYNAKMQLKADTNVQLSPAAFNDWKSMESMFLYGMTTQFEIPPTYRVNNLNFRGYFVMVTNGKGGFKSVSFRPFRVVRAEQKLIQQEVIPAFKKYVEQFVSENPELVANFKANTTYFVPYSFRAVKPKEFMDDKGYFVPMVVETPRK